MESVGDMSFIYLQRMSGAVFSVLIVAVSSTMQISATDSLNIQGNESEGSRVAAVEGGDTNLPCDTRSPDDLDILQLVVWYREDTPIYSYDGRVNGPSAHWVEEALEGRARWHAQAPSALHLSKVEPSDAAEYRCRVDFHVSPTRNYRIMLDVIELPGKPVIFDEYGKELTGMTGPYVEGGFFQLTCMVKGGKPAPRVRWWHEDSVLAVSTPVGDRADEPHSLQLRVQNLTRDHLHAAYTCTADNAPLVPPKRTTIEVELYLRPLSVEILSELPLSVGREAKISCRSTGARPPATLSWWLDDREQLSTIEKQQDSEEGNETLSVIRWTPQLEHNGRVMVCRANHRTLNHTYMQSVLPLKVYFAPIVNLQLGSKLNPNDIEEGDDVYFECSVTANPPAYKVVWEHNGMVMQHNQRAGVIAGSAHLALQGVTRRQAGRYSCTASNVEGDGRSPAVHLQVMYKPVCRSESVVVVGVALQEAVRVLCEVEAHPPPDTFQWTLNNSAGAFEVDSARYTLESAAGRSTLTYAPATETDYGALTCRASNLAGQQRTPCRYTLRPAAPPDAPKNCTTMNITNDSLELRCEPGYDGGLMAKFVAECWAGGMLLKNESGTVAVWHLHSLGESRAIRLVVYAANARGRSVPVTLHTRTLAKLSPQMEAQGGTQWDMTWAVGGVTGLIGTVLLVTCVGLLAGSRLRRHRSTEHNSGVVSMKSYKSSPPSRTSPMASDDKNPDVVPLNQGTQSCTLERPPEPPPYSAVASAPPSSRSSHSLQSHRTHAHNPHEHAPTTPHTPHSDVLSERGDKWRIAGLESCGSTARARREVVTTCTPLLATAHQESCV